MQLILTGERKVSTGESVGTEMVAPIWAETDKGSEKPRLGDDSNNSYPTLPRPVPSKKKDRGDGKR